MAQRCSTCFQHPFSEAAPKTRIASCRHFARVMLIDRPSADLNSRREAGAWNPPGGEIRERLMAPRWETIDHPNANTSGTRSKRQHPKGEKARNETEASIM